MLRNNLRLRPAATHVPARGAVFLRDDAIELSWNGMTHKDVALLPTSYQQAKLVAKDNMR